MRRPEFIARQARRPSGLLGRVIAGVMSFETSPENEAVVKLLELEPADRVLEIGFGHGRTIQRVATVVRDGFVAGVDFSELMLRTASRRNRRSIRGGRVELRLGDSSSLPYADRTFDKALSVHTLYFWPDPGRHLREIHRVLKEGGRLVLGFTSQRNRAATEKFPASVYRFYSLDEVSALLRGSGFDVIRGGTWNFGSRIMDHAVAHRPNPANVEG